MISYDVYRLIHLFGIFLLLMALGGGIVRTILVAVPKGAAPGDTAGASRGRGLVAASHGIALLLILLGGFGMLARLDIGMQNWVFAKLGVWLVLGALLVLIRRAPALARPLWLAVPLLALLAGWIAAAKPF